MHPSPPSVPKPSYFEADFDEMWKLYPRKEAKTASLSAYQTQRRKGVDAHTLLTATQHFAAQMKKEKRDRLVIMLGSTFFGSKNRWEDYEKPPEPEYKEPIPKGAGEMFETEE
jgi:hypothetical protein